MTDRHGQIARYALAAFAAGLLVAAGASFRGTDSAPPSAADEIPDVPLQPSDPEQDAAAEARAAAHWRDARREALVEVGGPDAQAQDAAATLSERWRREASGERHQE